MITNVKFIVHSQRCIRFLAARPLRRAEPLDISSGLAAVARIAITSIALIMTLKLHQLIIESDDQPGGNPLSDEVPPLALTADLHRQ